MREWTTSRWLLRSGTRSMQRQRRQRRPARPCLQCARHEGRGDPHDLVFNVLDTALVDTMYRLKKIREGICMASTHSLQGIYGYPIEIQALFFMALMSALAMLKHDAEGKEFVERIVKRLHALGYHMRNYFWLDFQQLNDIYRYKTEYSHTAVNTFNVIPDSIPDWVFDFMPTRGGYFIGNVRSARMDFRWFALGNCVAIVSSLATLEQSMAIMDLIEERWEELDGEMPPKITYPAIESHEWRIVTGCDPKNTRWSYHNEGSWPEMYQLHTCGFRLPESSSIWGPSG